MFNKLIELYTKGDIAQLSTSILHSTSWKQHDFTAYGNMQIETLWLKSLAQFGFLTLTKKQQVQGENFSALYFELATEDNEKSISLTLIFEHNHSHIKQLHCVIDTVKLSDLLALSVEEVIAQLPTPDPLLLSQFDHQMHPQSYHAQPQDVGEMPASVNLTMSKWWSIWQQKDIASFDKVYASDADVNIAGIDCQGVKGFLPLRKFMLNLHNRINRSYCQLERLTFDADNNSIAIQWHIDGDVVVKGAVSSVRRIRIPVVSMMQLNDDNLIIAEQLQVDWLAICKGYNIEYPFI